MKFKKGKLLIKNDPTPVLIEFEYRMNEWKAEVEARYKKIQSELDQLAIKVDRLSDSIFL